MPWHHRFRTKLIITVFPILAAITVASLWVAERRFSVIYQRLFDTQFQAHIQAFESSRERRFEAISSKLEEIATLPALVEHLRNRSPDSAAAVRRLIDPLLQDLGRQRLTLEQSPGETWRRYFPRVEPPPPDRRSRPPPRSPFLEDLEARPPVLIMLLDAKGRPTSASSASQNGGAGLPEPQTRRAASFLRNTERPMSEWLLTQEVGYALTGRPGESRRQVREIFVTPVRDAAGAFLGALVFGLPLPTLDERVLFQESARLEHSQIMSGVWIGGHLVSNTIPEAKHADLAALIAREIQKTPHARGDLTFNVNGGRHRVIYRILNPDSPFERAAQVNLYSLEAVDREISGLRVTAAEIAAVAMLASLGLILFVSRGLSGPVSALTEATREIAAGNYAVRVPVRTRDEVGLLGQAFNQMSADLAQRERYRSVLNAVADPAVASRLLKEENRELGGAQKKVSVLFCDIRGFTALSEKMPAPAVIELLNHHMTAMTRVAYAHGGTVDKFVGDMIMVLFGAPESALDDIPRAVRCALAMHETRSRLNQDAALPLEIGIGVTTGLVVAGCMGSDQRLSYTVIGHRVNLAARLCALAGAGQTIIDENTCAGLPSIFRVTPLPPARLKGISDLVPCHNVTGEQPPSPIADSSGQRA